MAASDFVRVNTPLDNVCTSGQTCYAMRYHSFRKYQCAL